VCVWIKVAQSREWLGGWRMRWLTTRGWIGRMEFWSITWSTLRSNAIISMPVSCVRPQIRTKRCPNPQSQSSISTVSPERHFGRSISIQIYPKYVHTPKAYKETLQVQSPTNILRTTVWEKRVDFFFPLKLFFINFSQPLFSTTYFILSIYLGPN